MTGALFTDEGPQYYDAAYQHNSPFARPGPYRTFLDPNQEKAFRSWVKSGQVPFDPDEAVSDYDMRGFWRDTGGSNWHKGQHFPDTYKTPFDTTFSRESRYATPDCPFVWQGDNLIDIRNGQLIFGSGATESGYGTEWHMEIRHADGSISNVPLKQSAMQGGPNETHWDADIELMPGDDVRVVTHE